MQKSSARLRVVETELTECENPACDRSFAQHTRGRPRRTCSRHCREVVGRQKRGDRAANDSDQAREIEELRSKVAELSESNRATAELLRVLLAGQRRVVDRFAEEATLDIETASDRLTNPTHRLVEARAVYHVKLRRSADAEFEKARASMIEDPAVEADDVEQMVMNVVQKSDVWVGLLEPGFDFIQEVTRYLNRTS